MTSPEEFTRIIEQPNEDENLEFKQANNTFALPRIYKYCVAIANEGGGKLVLGVSDAPPRQVVGTSAIPSKEDTASKIFNKLKFRVDIEVFDHSEGRVVIFHIPSRPRGTAYQHEGAYLMRSTENLVPMSEDRLRLIFNEGKPEWLLENASENCTSEDVVRLLDTQSYFDLLQLPYPSAREAVLERFKSEQLVVRQNSSWNITNLGAILFAKRLDSFLGLDRKSARVIVYEGKDKLNTLLSTPGIKGYAVGFESLIDYVSNQVPTNEVITKALRREVKMFPDDAIRELVANALIHQDFSESGTSVMIELYSDRLEITNPGLPPISTERFIDEYKSRNESLAGLMRRLGICEEKGSGIDRVVHSAEFHQLPAPDFRTGTLHTNATLYAHRDFSDMDRDAKTRACYQHCCLKYVTKQTMKNQTLRERFDLPKNKAEAVSLVIADTVAIGKIKLADPASPSKRFLLPHPKDIEAIYLFGREILFRSRGSRRPR